MLFKIRKLAARQIIRLTILPFSISFFTIGVIFSHTNVILIAICGMLIHNSLYAMERFNERIIFFSFNITFFTFLVARLVIKPLTGFEDRYNQTYYGLDFTDNQIILNIFIALFLSLVFLFLGYITLKKKDYTEEIRMVKNGNMKYIALVSKLLFYVSFLFNVLVLTDKAKYTSVAGYSELYSSYISSYPSFVVKLAEMGPTALFVFLGTMPTKRQSILPLSFYLILGILSLVVGQRNNFVLNILVIVVYLALRNLIDKKERWFGKKHIIAGIMILPLMIVLLNTVSYTRSDQSVTANSNSVASEFLYSQGVSVNLLGYAQSLEHELPEDKIYTIGRIVEFIQENALTQAMTDIPSYDAQTVESALYGNSFADSVSYSVSPVRYKNGWGYGSSYIAELYKDAQIIGVIVGSYILGIILSLLTNLFTRGILGVWMSLSMTRLLLYAPRDTFTSFIVSTFSLINLLTLVIIFLGANLISGQSILSLKAKRSVKKV